MIESFLGIVRTHKEIDETQGQTTKDTISLDLSRQNQQLTAKKSSHKIIAPRHHFVIVVLYSNR